jgi:hypothetical protein
MRKIHFSSLSPRHVVDGAAKFVSLFPSSLHLGFRAVNRSLLSLALVRRCSDVCSSYLDHLQPEPGLVIRIVRPGLKLHEFGMRLSAKNR